MIARGTHAGLQKESIKPACLSGIENHQPLHSQSDCAETSCLTWREKKIHIHLLYKHWSESKTYFAASAWAPFTRYRSSLDYKSIASHKKKIQYITWCVAATWCVDDDVATSYDLVPDRFFLSLRRGEPTVRSELLLSPGNHVSVWTVTEDWVKQLQSEGVGGAPEGVGVVSWGSVDEQPQWPKSLLNTEMDDRDKYTVS